MCIYARNSNLNLSAGDSFQAFGAAENPEGSGFAYSSDRGEMKEPVRPSFVPQKGQAPGPPSGAGPDNGIPCVVRSEDSSISPVPIPAGVVMVDEDGSTLFYMPNTPGVGVVPGGFDPFMTRATAEEVQSDSGTSTEVEQSPADVVAASPEGVGGEKEKDEGASGAIIGATAAAVAVVAIALLAFFALRRGKAAAAVSGNATAVENNKSDKPETAELKAHPGHSFPHHSYGDPNRTSGRFLMPQSQDQEAVSTAHYAPMHPPNASYNPYNAYSTPAPLSDRPILRHAYIAQTPQSERASAGAGFAGTSRHYANGHYPGSGYEPASMGARSVYAPPHNAVGGSGMHRYESGEGLQAMSSGGTTLEALSGQNSATTAALASTDRSVHNMVRFLSRFASFSWVACMLCTHVCCVPTRSTQTFFNGMGHGVLEWVEFLISGDMLVFLGFECRGMT